MVLQEKGTTTSESALCGETVRKFSGHKNFYSPAPGLEVTRLLSAMALSKDIAILFGVSVAFMNTPMPEGDPVYALRDASRLFHQHFAAVLTSRLRFTRPEAHPTLFVDLARKVFIAEHVDDLIMVGSSPQ